MGTVRDTASKLRKKGYSYTEINQKLGVAKSTLSGWFSDMPLNAGAQERLKGRTRIGTEALIRRNKAQTHLARKRAKETQYTAKKKVAPLSKYELLLVGAALYWAEGGKRAMKNGKETTLHAVSFSNTDPDMIRLYLRFVREVLEVSNDKIKIGVRIFEHSNPENIIRYWSKITGVPSTQFERPNSSISRSSLGKKPYNRLPYGTIRVKVNSTQKFNEVIGYIEGLKRNMLG